MIFSKTTLTASPSHKVKGLVSPVWDAQRKGTSDADTGEHTEAGWGSHRAPDTSHHLQICSEGCLRDRQLKEVAESRSNYTSKLTERIFGCWHWMGSPKDTEGYCLGIKLCLPILWILMLPWILKLQNKTSSVGQGGLG